MIDKLLDIAIHKQGNKRQLGIYMGFPEKYATQRVNKLIDNKNVTFDTLQKLLSAAGLDRYFELAILSEHEKIFTE